MRHLGRKGKPLTGRDGAGRKPVGAFGVTLQTYTLYYYYHSFSTDGFQYTLTLRFQLVSRSISYIFPRLNSKSCHAQELSQNPDSSDESRPYP
jgi:hypothetical protein